MDLIWTDTVPSVEGWYWELRKGSKRILYLPVNGVWPKSGDQLRTETFQEADYRTRCALIQLPESSWTVQWAGPIPLPKDLEAVRTNSVEFV